MLRPLVRSQTGNVVAGWSIDYASSDPNFIVVLADGGYAGGPQESGYSTNDGQTWNAFPTLPPGGSFGGNIAASTPNNIIFASANGTQPYYTLDGGNTWNPITLPGVSSWSSFMGAYFDDTRVITADRVLANTFYLLYNGIGIFETTNGGVTWTEVNSSVTSGAELVSTPGEAGDLWLVSGSQWQCRESRTNLRRRPLAAFDEWRSDVDHYCQCRRALQQLALVQLRRDRVTPRFTW